MITDTGKNLSILIVTETGKDWQTFATWYSCYKNLPNANIALSCVRNLETPFQHYQWAKRLNVPILHINPQNNPTLNKLFSLKKAHDNKLIGETCLILTPYILATDIFEPKMLQIINNNKNVTDGFVYFCHSSDNERLINEYFIETNSFMKSPVDFVVEAKENESPSSLISYEKGCGKWIHTSRGCPISSAAGLVSENMTLNENRIIELWKRMCSLYAAVT